MTDDYIAKIDSVLKAVEMDGLGDLVEEIAAVFASADPHIRTGLDRYKARAIVPGQHIAYDDRGDLAKLRGKLIRLKETERRELEADPVRLALSVVDDDLDECERLLSFGPEEEAQSFVDRMVQVYGAEIENIAVGLGSYGFGSEGATFKDDLRYIRGHLRHYRATLAVGFAKAVSHSVSVQTSSVSSSNVENVVTITQAAEQVQAIPESILSDDLKKELELLLLDLDMSKGKMKTDAEGRLKKVLGWLADKGVDVALAALPYVLNVLQTLA